jgi:hypothetical protein
MKTTVLALALLAGIAFALPGAAQNTPSTNVPNTRLAQTDRAICYKACSTAYQRCMVNGRNSDVGSKVCAQRFEGCRAEGGC